MDVTPCCGSKPSPPQGRSIPARGGLHRLRHPEYVEGCFGCKVLTQGVALAGHASARGDGISHASQLKLEHQERAKHDPDIAPVQTRAFIR